MGAGAYVCGEETALIESIEGNRGSLGSSRLSQELPDCGQTNRGKQRRNLS